MSEIPDASCPREGDLPEHTTSGPEQHRTLSMSVVIPAYNEAQRLPQALEAVFRARMFALFQDPLRRIEIIVVDNASTDGTGAIAESLGARVIVEENHGYAATRNAGLKVADGDIILTLDADSIAPETLIHAHLEKYEDPSVIAVSGGGRLSGTHPFFSLLRKLYSFYIHRRGTTLTYDAELGWEGAGYNASYRRAVIDKVGEYREVHGEDVDLWERLKAFAEQEQCDPKLKVLDARDDEEIVVETSGRRYESLLKILIEVFGMLRKRTKGRAPVR